MGGTMVHFASKALEDFIAIPAMVVLLCKTGEKSVVIVPAPPSTFTVSHRPRRVLTVCLQQHVSLHDYHSWNDILMVVNFDFDLLQTCEVQKPLPQDFPHEQTKTATVSSSLVSDARFSSPIGPYDTVIGCRRHSNRLCCGGGLENNSGRSARHSPQ